MYHIKDDQRSKKSAELLCHGLATVLHRKAYDEITISDACSACGIARTTFYRLFDTLDDVLLYQFDLLFEESIREYQQSKKQDKSYARFILQAAMDNQALTVILVNSGRLDLFDFSTRANEAALLQKLHLDLDDQRRRYCTPMLNAMVFALIRTWAANGCKETTEELYALLKTNLELIEKYL